MSWAYAVIFAWSVGMPASVTPAAPPMPRPEQIMAVPPELHAQLQQQVIAAGGSERMRLERLAEFLFRKSGLGMEYSADATLTVEQAYRTRKANCLTFTLLTVALARESGLQAYAQELDDIVAGRVDDDIVYRFNHVNAGFTIGHSRFTIDVARDLVKARGPPKPISDQRLLALYYNNRAAELLAAASPAAAVAVHGHGAATGPGLCQRLGQCRCAAPTPGRPAGGRTRLPEGAGARPGQYERAAQPDDALPGHGATRRAAPSMRSAWRMSGRKIPTCSSCRPRTRRSRAITRRPWSTTAGPSAFMTATRVSIAGWPTRIGNSARSAPRARPWIGPTRSVPAPETEWRRRTVRWTGHHASLPLTPRAQMLPRTSGLTSLK